MKTKQKRIIKNWLYSGLLLMALMVIIGGITRLTHSGLSMVEWSVTGDLPTEKNILISYKSWQDSPQGIELSYTFNEFKKIYFWEYIHRMTGRFLGLLFIIPFVTFWLMKWINPKEKRQLLILLALGSLQALLGWFMVKSGLVDIPQVSHFRLAIHLVVSFAIMCYTYWLILSFTKSEKSPNKSINIISQFLIIALIIQIIYGAFVAGLKAGYFLPANGSFLEIVFGYNIREANDFNLLHKDLDIQAFHRLFAWIVFVITLILFNKTRKTALANAGFLVIGLTITQIILGISTLLLRVQIHTAVAHQLFAIILLLSVVRITYLSSEKSRLSA